MRPGAYLILLAAWGLGLLVDRDRPHARLWAFFFWAALLGLAYLIGSVDATLARR